MRQLLPCLLFTAWLVPLQVQAEETIAVNPESETEPTAQSVLQVKLDELQQRLAQSEQQREALAAELNNNQREIESAQLQRLRQDNQRLKLELKRVRAEQPAPLVSEQQMWFAIGGATALLCVLFGALLRGNGRKRSGWAN